MSALLIITKTFFHICWLRKGPQDLPAAPEFLSLCILANFVSSILLSLSSRIFVVAVAASLLEILWLLLFTYIVLSLRSLAERWMQTCTALAGTGTLFNLMALPLFDWFASKQTGQALYLLLFVALLIWSLSVMAHIFKHALAISFPASMMVSILLILCMTALNTMIFPSAVLQ